LPSFRQKCHPSDERQTRKGTPSASFCGLSVEATECDECVGAAVDDRQHVAGLVGLGVAVAVQADDGPACRADSSGRCRMRKGSWTSVAMAASTQACSASVALVRTVVVA
jgi:hypothetical protein